MPEHIKHEAGQPDEWVCLCHNRADADGFFPCDAHGVEVEPDAKWGGTLYVCTRCGRIIDQFTRAVQGRAAFAMQPFTALNLHTTERRTFRNRPDAEAWDASACNGEAFIEPATT